MEIALARLIGFAVGLLLSAIFTGLFCAAVYTLERRKKRRTNISIVIPCVLAVMFMLNTTQMSLQAADIYNAFFKYRDQDGGPSAYFMDYGSKILPARDATFWIMSVLADGLVCWRLYVIWLKNKYIIILPVVLLTCGLTCGVVMFIYTIKRMIEDSPRHIPTIDRWWMITIGFTIAVNLVTPVLIIGRLWYIARQVGVLGSKASWPYKQIASALIESGALYTLGCAAWLVIFTTGSLPALYMSACILPTIVAIVPTLIILRLNTFGPDPTSHLAATSQGSVWAVAAGSPIDLNHCQPGHCVQGSQSPVRVSGTGLQPASRVSEDEMSLKANNETEPPERRIPTPSLRLPPPPGLPSPTLRIHDSIEMNALRTP